MNKDKQTVIERFSQKGVFPPQMAFTLLIPLRNIFLSPKKLLSRLELKEDDTVLELGPGPGYFSSKIANKLTKGVLYLADIQQEMLDHAKRRLDKKGIKNVRYNLCDGNTLPYSDSFFDVIYMVTVLGEVQNKQTYVLEFKRLMKTGGTLSISEQAGDPDKLSQEEIIKLMDGSGFDLVNIFGTARNFTLNFKKK